MNHKFTFSFFMLVLGFACGCGAGRPSKYYQLTIPDTPPAKADVHRYPVKLLLGPITSSDLYRGDRIVYSSSGRTMGTYEYQRWVGPPTEMIQDVLSRELRSSGLYRTVYSWSSNAHGDYRLLGKLYDFKEVSGNTLVGRVTLELELRETKTGSTVWTHHYTHDEPVNGKDVPAVVEALDRNVQRGVNEFMASLDQYFSAHLPASTTASP
ncbi:MAG: ABC-type transport auxiliary lipoprotein family protein [Terriglobia bacterium]